MIHFQPTALLIFTHNITGLKYFGKTTKLNNINSYKGSGKYWKKHLKAHGRLISISVLGTYYTQEECMNVAIKFSKDNNIVQSDEWANLIEENGLDGQPSGEMHTMYGKPSPCIGQKRPWVGKKGKGNPMYGKPSPMRGVAKPKGKDSPLYGRPRPEGGGKPSKAVIRFDIHGNQKHYNSIADASKDVGVTRSMIRRCCEGKQKTSAGYTWKFKEQ